MRQVYCYDASLVSALFPELQPVTESVFVAQGQIYVGRGVPAGDPYAFQLTRALLPGTEVSIPDRWTAVQFCFQKRKVQTVPKSLQPHVEKLEPDEFLRELLYFMAAGKWKKLSSADAKVYELFDALTQSKHQFFIMYFTLRKDYSYQELWASVLTFFIRVVNYDSKDPNISNYYKTVIEKFHSQSSKLSNLVQMLLGQEFTEVFMLQVLLSVR